MLHSVIQLVAAIVILGVVVWGMDQLPIDDTFKRVAKVVAIVALVIWVVVILIGMVGIAVPK